ncbi:MAG: S46 family peptidase [Bacteroidales bacterium]|jgi:hypothetical protein|nr:S46 family peptidase [Bacteroidales bacterium]
MKRKLIPAVVTLFLSAVLCRADEGMWLIHLIEQGLAKNMQERGLQLDPNTLYDEEKGGLSDAVVSLAFGCSGSMISSDGLMITNHHCAYSDVHALSTPEHNYLEDGFWAMDRSQEAPVKGDGIWFLKKVIDVTSEVQHLRDSIVPRGGGFAMRRVYSLIEGRYGRLFKGQGEVSCSSMWGGNKYYMALYEVYKDVRLVAAPPICIASFGGEVDNWEWPQHKGDFALYRIYTAPDGSPAEYSPDNIPMKPSRTLKISTAGVQRGDFAMVIGYPGRTDRYASSFKVNNIETVVNPIQVEIQGEQMKIIDGWMNLDPAVRLKYADHYFSLSNVQEIREGEIFCYSKYNVAEKKREQEVELHSWIMSDSLRAKRYGTLLHDLGVKYKSLEYIEKQTGYYRETMARGVRLHRMLNHVARSAEMVAKSKGQQVPIADSTRALETIMKMYDEFDMRVEKDLIDLSIREFYAHVDSVFWGEWLTEQYDLFEGDTYALVDWIWENSLFTDQGRFEKALSEATTAEKFRADPLMAAINSTKMIMYNNYKSKVDRGIKLTRLENNYRNLLYQMNLEKGIPQYPDANSTMRITYGTVGPLRLCDGIICLERSTVRGILEKYDPNRYIYSLKPELKALYDARDWGRWADASTGELYINFVTDNDITGGNSGSPVMNGRGELIGLAFDGNKESLAGDTYFDPVMNKCVCVDIRYVLWILDKYAGMQHIIAEMLGE